MSILDQVDDQCFVYGGGGTCSPPLRDFCSPEEREANVALWVSRAAEKAADPFYSRWSLASLCEVDSYPSWGWLDGILDSRELWLERLGRFRAVLGATGDRRAEEECHEPRWLGKHEARRAALGGVNPTPGPT